MITMCERSPAVENHTIKCTVSKLKINLRLKIWLNLQYEDKVKNETLFKVI